MKQPMCPVCERKSLSSAEVEAGLGSLSCPLCLGHWITSSEYSAWVASHGKPSAGSAYTEYSQEPVEVKKAKMCPQCRTILAKFKVGHGMGFRLDHCNTCNGVWLDKDEWKVLKERDLHLEINRMFTTVWQHNVREEERRRHSREFYEKTFGAKEYEEILRLRAWVTAHPKRSLILAYLSHPDPEQ